MGTTVIDHLLSTCARFINLEIRNSQTCLDHCNADYYLITSRGESILIGKSKTQNTSHAIYEANRIFVMKYCALYDLGHKFIWEDLQEFKAWMYSIINTEPRYISPHQRSMLSLPTHNMQLQGRHSCWFVARIEYVGPAMKVIIPPDLCQFLHAPSEGICILYSGKHASYVKIEDSEFTEGWYQLARRHVIYENYTVMFAAIGHLLFDMYVFDEEGCQVFYPWYTAEPIQHTNSPTNWDPIAVLQNANNIVIETGYMPALYRQTFDDFRFCKKMTIHDLHEMVIPNRYSTWLQENEVGVITLETGHRQWEVNCWNGIISGRQWFSFVKTHQLKTNETVVIISTVDLDHKVMIFGTNRSERIFPWY